jgi:hypothetical protein
VSVLKRLDALREGAPKDSLLAEAVAEASEAIGGLVGYFVADNHFSLTCAKCGHAGEIVYREQRLSWRMTPWGRLFKLEVVH